MSANIIPTFQIEQFSATIELLVQQMGSRLRGTMREGQHMGDQASPVDQIGIIEAKKVTSRFAPIVRTDAPTDRRWVAPVDYDLAQQVDSFDKLRIINNPEGHLVQSAVNAIGRKYDDEMIAAFFGSAMTGQKGATSTVFLSGNIVAANFKASAACGLTAAKIIEAKRLLQIQEVDVDMEELFIVISATQHANLMAEILITSKDFNSAPVFDQKGMIKSWYGFTFIHSERLTATADPYTQVPVYAKSGMYFATWNALYTKVSQRDDLQGHPWQVYNMATFGATRLQEKKVVQIQCA